MTNALVLCGGTGSRLKEISSSPKILIEFGERKFIDWLIKYLLDNKFKKIYFSVCYKKSEIIDYVKENYDEELFDFIIEENPLGTGGAVRNFFNQHHLKDVFLINGDTYWSKDIPCEILNASPNELTLMIKSLPVNDRYGDIQNIQGNLLFQRGSVKSPILNSNVFAGIARVPRVFTDFSGKNAIGFEEVLEKYTLISNLIKYDGDMIDFGIPDAYLKLLKI